MRTCTILFMCLDIPGTATSHGHMYDIPSCMLHICICVSHTSRVLEHLARGQGAGFFLHDTDSEGWLSSGPCYLSSLVLPVYLFPRGGYHGHSLSGERLYISRSCCGKNHVYPKQVKVWVKSSTSVKVVLHLLSQESLTKIVQLIGIQTGGRLNPVGAEIRKERESGQHWE